MDTPPKSTKFGKNQDSDQSMDIDPIDAKVDKLFLEARANHKKMRDNYRIDELLG